MSGMVARFYTVATQTLARVMESQAAQIEAAGRLGAEAILGGGLIHIFGTGHSHMIAEELFGRAGGLVLVNPIFNSTLMLHEGIARSGATERLPGYAERILALEPLSAGDLLIVVSNSGRNAVPVEAALYGRAKGLKVVAITSMAHTLSQPANHPGGQRLYEVADVVIDNGGIAGDAALEVPGSSVRACATSTLAATFIAQAIQAAVVERLAAAGMEPLPILRSGNLDGAKEHNDRVRRVYGDRVARIPAYLR